MLPSTSCHRVGHAARRVKRPSRPTALLENEYWMARASLELYLIRSQRNSSVTPERPPMTVQYAIVAFPTLRSADLVEAVRSRFDPLAAVLKAHVTLVFPFSDSAMAPYLADHITQAVAGLAPFDMSLTRPRIADAGYLFLTVAAGSQHFVNLHDRLYSGPLARHLSLTRTYEPHITIGRLPTADRLAAAAREATQTLTEPLLGRVDHVAVFRLDQPSHGSVAFTVPLASSA